VAIWHDVTLTHCIITGCELGSYPRHHGVVLCPMFYPMRVECQWLCHLTAGRAVTVAAVMCLCTVNLQALILSTSELTVRWLQPTSTRLSFASHRWPLLYCTVISLLCF